MQHIEKSHLVTPTSEHSSWHKDMVLYQVYLRSFADSNDDGIGDLPGLTEKIAGLSELGINTLWLSPIHPSPDFDHGYDITDYRAIDPRFGTLDDFDRLVAVAQQNGIRIIMDGVYNHCSTQHPWFLEASHHQQSKYHDYFHWHSQDKPPNNWLSIMGGSAWEWSKTANAYYLHSFLPQQADLNWHNPALRREIYDTMNFWLKRGVSGFRLDVFNCYVKDKQRRSNPKRKNLTSLWQKIIWPYAGQIHLHDRDQAELENILRDMRKLAQPYHAILIGETLDDQHTYNDTARWIGNDKLHMAFNFRLLNCPWGPLKMRLAIDDWNRQLKKEGWPIWVISNHDYQRHATRWRGKNTKQRMRLMALLLLTLRGSPCLYQGEEIGMRHAKIPKKLIQDPLGKRFWPFYRGRDGARTPMQWNGSLHAGFSTVTPWLPVNDDYAMRNVAQQQQNPASLRQLYKKLIKLRRLYPALSKGDMQLTTSAHKKVLSFSRITDHEHIIIILNLSHQKQTYQHDPSINPTYQIILSTVSLSNDHADNTSIQLIDSPVILQPHEGLLLKVAEKQPPLFK